jgi:hypothetical protein
MDLLLALPAPAKINLFLHVIGRRADGYHELQTAFQLIDLADWLDFERRSDGAIVREGDLLGAADDDLAVRAARALQEATATHLGATIGVAKRIPAGRPRRRLVGRCDNADCAESTGTWSQPGELSRIEPGRMARSPAWEQRLRRGIGSG